MIAAVLAPWIMRAGCQRSLTSSTCQIAQPDRLSSARVEYTVGHYYAVWPKQHSIRTTFTLDIGEDYVFDRICLSGSISFLLLKIHLIFLDRIIWSPLMMMMVVVVVVVAAAAAAGCGGGGGGALQTPSPRVWSWVQEYWRLCRGSQIPIFGIAGPASSDGGMADRLKYTPPNMCWNAKFNCCWTNGTSIRTEICRKIEPLASHHLKSQLVTRTHRKWSSTSDFLLVIHSNHGSISCRFQDIAFVNSPMWPQNGKF